jgi:hypothetical protein
VTNRWLVRYKGSQLRGSSPFVDTVLLARAPDDPEPGVHIGQFGVNGDVLARDAGTQI